MEKNPYIELAECLLPEEMVEYFEVVKVEKTKETLDVTLEERDNGVDGYEAGQLRPNGFYEESTVRDYPVRGRKMTFHVKRRRWVEIETGKSVSKRWDIVGRHPLLERVRGFFKRYAWIDTRLRAALLSGSSILTETCSSVSTNAI